MATALSTIRGLAAKGRVDIGGDMVFNSIDRGSIMSALKKAVSCVLSGPFFHVSGPDLDGKMLLVVVKCDGATVYVEAAEY